MTHGDPLDEVTNLDDLLQVIESKRVALAPEVAGYLALEIATAADKSMGELSARGIMLSEEGTVGLVQPRQKDTPAHATEASIRALLGRLLVATGSQTPALAVVVRKGGGGGLRGLAEELEAALVPVNRAAGRRALARLVRDGRRVMLGVGRNALTRSEAPPARVTLSVPPPGRGESERNPPAAPLTVEVIDAPRSVRPAAIEVIEAPRSVRPGPLGANDASEIPALAVSIPPASRAPTDLLTFARDAELEESLEFEEAPVVSTRLPDRPVDEVSRLLADFVSPGDTIGSAALELKELAGVDPTPPPMSLAGPVEAVPASMGAPTSNPTPSVPSVRPPPTAGLSPIAAPRVSRTRRLWLVGFLLLALGLSALAVWRLRPRWLGARGQSSAHVQPAPNACRASLTIQNVPPQAELLLHVGRTPVVVERMPVGTRLEFVLTLDGRAPKRVLLPAGAKWEKDDRGRLRTSVNGALDPPPKGGENWPVPEAGSVVGGKGPPGIVRVESSPAGADVWLLVGVGGTVTLDTLSCDQDAEVLVAGPAALRKRYVVRESSFVRDRTDPTLRTAELRVD